MTLEEAKALLFEHLDDLTCTGQREYGDRLWVAMRAVLDALAAEKAAHETTRAELRFAKDQLANLAYAIAAGAGTNGNSSGPQMGAPSEGSPPFTPDALAEFEARDFARRGRHK